MANILHIKSSILGEAGQSNALSQNFVEQYASTHVGSEVVTRDLGENPVPHLTGEAIGGFGLAEGERNATQEEALRLSNKLINELREADVVVLGLPMYNFGVPSALKAWIDYVARAGETFRYTEMGPEGLLKGKKAYVLAARGGKYFGTAADSQTAFINTFFNFIGISDIEIIYAEGLAMGDEPRTQALDEANRRVKTLAAA